MTTFPEILPSCTVPFAMDAPALRWGILGPGWISHHFVKSLKTYTQQKIAPLQLGCLGSQEVPRLRRKHRDRGERLPLLRLSVFRTHPVSSEGRRTGVLRASSRVVDASASSASSAPVRVPWSIACRIR
jgi:hypothetical protein